MSHILQEPLPTRTHKKLKYNDPIKRNQSSDLCVLRNTEIKKFQMSLEPKF